MIYKKKKTNEQKKEIKRYKYLLYFCFLILFIFLFFENNSFVTFSNAAIESGERPFINNNYSLFENRLLVSVKFTFDLVKHQFV